MSLDLFPTQTPSYILSFQFSSWYPIFSDISIKSTIIKPLSKEFKEYLEAESIFVPEGSEDIPVDATLSEDEDDEAEDDDDEETAPSYAFPELDAQIRNCIQQYGADAAWVLPASSPLKCTTPADVYLLLKSSDFVSHDLDVNNIFEGCEKDPSEDGWPTYELELVLRKWYAVQPSREVRCFVKDGNLIAISQRDTNHYDFLNEPETQDTIRNAITTLWRDKIQHRIPEWKDYTFDLLLTQDLSRGHIIDFNPYAPRTDSLLFSYDELRNLAVTSPGQPEFRVIDSPSHPASTRMAPTHQHNMLPIEAMQMSQGKSIEEFAEEWQARMADAAKARPLD